MWTNCVGVRQLLREHHVGAAPKHWLFSAFVVVLRQEQATTANAENNELATSNPRNRNVDKARRETSAFRTILV